METIPTIPLIIHPTINDSSLSISEKYLTPINKCAVKNDHVPGFCTDDIPFIDEEEDAENID